MNFQKFPYWRSEGYRRWVAARPCIACGVEGYSQCAHSNQARHGKGRGIKASDEFTFPLCSARPGIVGCHSWHDQHENVSTIEPDAFEDEAIARTWAAAEVDGWHAKRAKA